MSESEQKERVVARNSMNRESQGRARFHRVGIVAVAVLGSMLVAASTVAADAAWSETKLTADDGTNFDEFGRSVAVDGDRVVIGSRRDDNENGEGAGATYVFDHDGGGSWIETKLLASDGSEFDGFGLSVAVDGERIVVGAPEDDDIGNNSGSAYVFEPDGAGGWTETKLLASDGAPDTWFGGAVAVDGDRVVVGAIRDVDNGEWSGAAYVFERDGAGGWTETKLIASDGAPHRFFGQEVAIDGDRIVVGERNAAYIYEVADDGAWVETKLISSDRAGQDQFGWSVAVAGDRVVISANLDDDAGSGSGSVYIYELNAAGDWVETKLTASDGASNDQFGDSVAVDGDRIVVGASGPSYVSRWLGATYVYEPDDAGRWSETKLTTDRGSDEDRYGRPVAVSGDRIVVGAMHDRDTGVKAGAAYVYELDSGPSCVEITGTEASDVLVGTAGNDCIFGLGGDDIIRGLGGDDVLVGGEGDDLLVGGPGADWLRGGPGIDTADYSESPGPVWVAVNKQADDGQPGEGDQVDLSIEIVIGSSYDDTLLGSVSADRLVGRQGDDVIRGRGGDDELVGNSGNDLLVGGPGDDSLYGWAGADYCRGSAGTDTYFGCETTLP